MLGPSLGGRILTPGLPAFIDAAFLDGYFKDLESSQASVIASTGLGVFVSILARLNLTCFAAFPIAGSTLSGATVVPGASLHLSF